jgi:hypothetical protein
MAGLPSAEEQRRKAEECREEAAQYTVSKMRAQMLATAVDYEQLAQRASEFDQRTRVGANNDRALTNWREQ